MSFKKKIKPFIPPILLDIKKIFRTNKNSKILWSGNYATWADANANSTGYDAEHILERCKNSILKVKNDEAAYERDSVLFDRIQYAWPLLASLQNAALANNGNLCVLDFGGSLGSTYYQNREFLKVVKNLQWCIVEQEAFVNCGKDNFEDDTLKFYHTIEECVSKHSPHVLLLSSVLQYLPNPFEWIEKFISLKIPFIIIDRTGFISEGGSILTVQSVPEKIYEASYPCWFFNETEFINEFLKRYITLVDFNDSFTEPVVVNDHTGFWKGFYLKEKQ